MQWLKAIFKFYIDSSIHVSLAVCALMLSSVYLLPVQISTELVAFVFLSTVTGYNFVKYAGVARLHHMSLAKNLRVIQLFSLACFVGLLVMASYQRLEVILISAFLGVFTLLYAVPFLPHRKNLRSLQTIKVFIIAFVWAGTAVWLPLENFSFVFSVEVMLRFLQLFVFVLALIIPFEIRDLSYDSMELKTFPQLIGVTKTKGLGYVFLMVFLILEIVLTAQIENLISAIIIAVVLGVMIFSSSKKQSTYYASFWVELIPVIWLALLWGSQELFV